MKLIISALLSALLSMLLLSTSAWAAAGEDDTSGSSEPPAWKKAVADQDWAGAITPLEAQVAANNGTANVHNMIATPIARRTISTRRLNIMPSP